MTCHSAAQTDWRMAGGEWRLWGKNRDSEDVQGKVWLNVTELNPPAIGDP